MRAELSGDVTPTPYVRITGTLGQLRLDSMATNVREPMSWVVDGYRSLPVSLLKTASNEVRYRREYITQCQIENASLPCVKTLQDIYWSFQQSVATSGIEKLAHAGTGGADTKTR
jgi:hypothetical protein